MSVTFTQHVVLHDGPYLVTGGHWLPTWGIVHADQPSVLLITNESKEVLQHFADAMNHAASQTKESR